MATSTGKTLGLLLLVILILLVLGSFGPFMLIPFAPILHIFQNLAGHTGAMVEFHRFGPFGAGMPPVFIMGLGLLMTLFWIFVIVWVYNDAERRGMSGILWALLVLVGNIIGLIIYLIIRSGAEAGVGPASPLQPSQRRCPACSNAIRDDFLHCPHCGAELKGKCPSCGKDVQADWQVCPFCGHSLRD